MKGDGVNRKVRKSEPQAVADIKPDVSAEEHSSGEEESDESSSENDSSNHSENSQHSVLHARTTPRRSAKQPHPPGFKEIRSRIQPFSGKQGEEDFQLWLEDYEEATNDCQWSDKVRARWFSWFISGPAKATKEWPLTS